MAHLKHALLHDDPSFEQSHDALPVQAWWSPWKKTCAVLLPLVFLIGVSYVSVHPLAGHVGIGGDTAGAQGVHTRPPTQQEIDRCLRETADYNERMGDGWRATHPGQVLPHPVPWPSYQCGPVYEYDPPSSTVPAPSLTSTTPHNSHVSNSHEPA